MKAIVNEKFGKASLVMKLQQVEKPVPSEQQVLVKIHATSVNTIDCVFRSGKKAIFGLARLSTGIRKPKMKILGFDISGEVVEVSNQVSDFKVGDKVFGHALTGGNAEFALASVNEIAKKPQNITHQEAAAIPMAALSALQGLRLIHIQPGSEILIYGASGGIGTYAVQLAKQFGLHVTAVTSAKNEQLVRRLGAEDFIDYRTEDFTSKGKKYDIIFDTVAKVPNWKIGLKESGVFISAGSPSMSMIGFFGSILGNKLRKKKFLNFNTKYSKSDLEYLAQLTEAGSLKSEIDKSTLSNKYLKPMNTMNKVIQLEKL